MSLYFHLVGALVPVGVDAPVKGTGNHVPSSRFNHLFAGHRASGMTGFQNYGTLHHISDPRHNYSKEWFFYANSSLA